MRLHQAKKLKQKERKEERKKAKTEACIKQTVSKAEEKIFAHYA